jgi:hypothetical protein
MNLDSLKSLRGVFLFLALLGFSVINLPFLYFFFFEKAIYDVAMTNGVALVFMAEAFLLMFIFAFLIGKVGWKKPGWFIFIVLSIVGSLAFSIPFFLYLHTGKRR